LPICQDVCHLAWLRYTDPWHTFQTHPVVSLGQTGLGSPYTHKPKFRDQIINNYIDQVVCELIFKLLSNISY